MMRLISATQLTKEISVHLPGVVVELQELYRKELLKTALTKESFKMT